MEWTDTEPIIERAPPKRIPTPNWTKIDRALSAQKMNQLVSSKTISKSKSKTKSASALSKPKFARRHTRKQRRYAH